MSSGPQSIYIFDFDKNIMQVKVKVVLINSLDGTKKEMSFKKYKSVKELLGKQGKWEHWSDKDLFLNYRDIPDVPSSKQPFANQIKAAINSGDTKWQGLAWPMFVHACNAQRPVSLITARGHSDETIKAGFQILKDNGLINHTPNYLTLFNVTYPPTRAKLGDPDGTSEVDDLKRKAIMMTVDATIEKFGIHEHHFGMSDDTMVNVEAVADAMVACKEEYPDMRFFVIATNADHRWKAELFPANVPVKGHGDVKGPEPLGS